MIWKYNETTQIEKERLITQIGVSHFDCGMQIRGGDKFLEANIIKPITYLDSLDSLCPNCKSIFLLTDDYEIIEFLRKERKDVLIYSFCTDDQHGYYNNDFYKKNKMDIYRQMVRLLVSVDILKDCDTFIGTISANPSKCVYIKKQGKNFISLD